MEILSKLTQLLLSLQISLEPISHTCMRETKELNLIHRKKICLIEKHLVKQESGGNINARSPKGAMGKYQIMPSTYREFSKKIGAGKNPYNVKDNTMVGRAYIDFCIHKFNGDIRLGLSCYNAGPNRVSKLLNNSNKKDYKSIENKLPKETQRYVFNIMSNLKKRNT